MTKRETKKTAEIQNIFTRSRIGALLSKKYAEDHGRKPLGESVPAEGWKLLKGKIL